MRVLLDENVPHRLRHDFGDEFEVETVQYRGWESIDNGDLMRLAQEQSFDALLTTDRGIEHQHSKSTRSLRSQRATSPTTNWPSSSSPPTRTATKTSPR